MAFSYCHSLFPPLQPQNPKPANFKNLKLPRNKSSLRSPSNLIPWNSLITKHRRQGSIQAALLTFFELRKSGIPPDSFTLSVLISVVQELADISLGCQVHALSIKFGYWGEEFVANSLIQMYASFETIDNALRVFEGMSDSASVVSWNSMIAEFVSSELFSGGLKLYGDMQRVGVEPTPTTLSSVLKSCANLKAVSEGKQVHAQVIVRGFVPNEILETVLVDFHCRCGEVENGRLVFNQMKNRNVFSWNSMIRGCSQIGYREEALMCFQAMRRGGITPDKFTYNAILAAAATEEDNHNLPREFRLIHASVIKAGLVMDRFIGTSLIAVYSRNHCLREAKLAFEDTNSTDMAVWSSMISATVKNREGQEAINLFVRMLGLRIEPNSYIFSSLFLACSDLSAIEVGKQIHGYSFKIINSLDSAAKNSLMTMYSNCGFLTEAMTMFDSISNPHLVSFNSMISVLAQHGLPNEASKAFKDMESFGLKPDDITLLNLLSAFNHAGLVSEGLELFASMEKMHGVKPKYQHYACIIDMLARAGEIDQAIGLINQMPFRPEPSLWRIVLGACGKHQNIGIGVQVAEKLIELEPHEATNYVLIANVYARLGRLAEAENIRHLMRDKGLKKEEGLSWIEIKRKMYKFRVEDKSHPQSKEIYDKLRDLMNKITSTGYEPDVSFTVHDIEEERREESLWYHAEKLAFAFGVISTGEGVKLRIMKNLRVCGDCHSAFKHFSLITKREILLKDNYRFHHFRDGACSCGDYW
ncbi:uncharacterized protein A4U43_C03F22340 [Asparagus officinalis]|uniref:DYW domain-containing protein n=1 Tax=Asparagus officinalis TaxID=4686 RepID=A0A5P1FEZ0_ASPOF|nr:pentatricopeptide repeat-containing protein At2g03880, mitochondrial-like [Asparagus officinalis]ONK75957.1 uncharacterized protein A4U43_C03F22340 [Asparagus officinalis]